jgi:hypothetical protein
MSPGFQELHGLRGYFSLTSILWIPFIAWSHKSYPRHLSVCVCVCVCVCKDIYPDQQEALGISLAHRVSQRSCLLHSLINHLSSSQTLFYDQVSIIFSLVICDKLQEFSPRVLFSLFMYFIAEIEQDCFQMR